MSTGRTTQQTAPQLQAEVTHAAIAVSTAFAKLLAALPPAHRPIDLARALGIDYTMCRKVLRIAEASDPILIAHEIPRPAALPRILKASANKGVDRAILQQLNQTIENFESLALRYAGDRLTFDAMLASLSPESAERANLDAKRSSYRAATRLLGRQVDTTAFFIAVRPSSQHDDYLESIWLCSQFGLKRFLPSVSLEAITTRFTLARPDGPLQWPTEPIKHNEPFHSDSFLITEFCSDPLPYLKPLPEQEEGFRRFEFDSYEVGLQSAVDCVTAQVVHAPRPIPDRNGQRLFGLQAMLDVPTACLFIDVFAHESLISTLLNPVCFSVSNAFPSHDVVPNDVDPSFLLPVQETARVVGRGPATVRASELPRYDQLIHHAFEKMNWPNPEKHLLVRCRIEYPILNAHYVLRIPV